MYINSPLGTTYPLKLRSYDGASKDTLVLKNNNVYMNELPVADPGNSVGELWCDTGAAREVKVET